MSWVWVHLTLPPDLPRSPSHSPGMSVTSRTSCRSQARAGERSKLPRTLRLPWPQPLSALGGSTSLIRVKSCCWLTRRSFVRRLPVTPSLSSFPGSGNLTHSSMQLLNRLTYPTVVFLVATVSFSLLSFLSFPSFLPSLPPIGQPALECCDPPLATRRPPEILCSAWPGPAMLLSRPAPGRVAGAAGATLTSPTASRMKQRLHFW